MKCDYKKIYYQARWVLLSSGWRWIVTVWAMRVIAFVYRNEPGVKGKSNTEITQRIVDVLHPVFDGVKK